MFKRKKGKSKGKAKGSNPGKDTTEVPFKAHGTISFNEQQKAERQRRISQIKARTQCSSCGQYGHWAGDSACQKSGGKQGKGKGRSSSKSPPTSSTSAYFAILDDDKVNVKAEADVVVAGEVAWAT